MDIDKKIFSSRTLMYFSDNKINTSFSMFQNKLVERDKCKNVIFSFFIIIFSIFILINCKEKTTLIFNYSIFFISLICLIFQLFTFYVFKKLHFFKAISRILNNYRSIINFTLLDLNFFCLVSNYELNKNIEFSLMLNTISSNMNILFVIFFIIEYKKMVAVNFSTLCVKILITKLNLSSNTWTLYPLFALNFLFNFLLGYFQELKVKLQFYYLQVYFMNNQNHFENICKNLKYPIISIDVNCAVNFSNLSFFKLNNISNDSERETIKCDDILIQPDIEMSFIRNKLIFPKNISTKDRKEIKAAVENILNNIRVINKDLEIQNKSLYTFLRSLQKDENSPPSLFNFSKMRELLIKSEIQSNNLIEKNEKESTDIRIKFQNNNERIFIPNSVEFNNSQTPLNFNDGKVKETEDKLQNIHLEKEILLNKNKLNAFESFIYLGESRIAEKHISIYVSITSDEKMNFLFEEVPNFILQKNKIVQICKSIYLSKISHEFKNPICNLQEIISTLQEKDIMNQTIINPKHFSMKNQNNNQVEMTNIEYLKCLTEFLSQIVKDFTFYSSFSTQNQIKAKSNSSSPNDSSQRFSRKSLLNFSENKEGSESHLLRSKLLINNKNCYYIDILEEQIELFKSRSIIDKKNSKLSFTLNFEGLVPKMIQIQSDTFKSLIFNLLYHIYINLNRVKVELKVKFEKINSEIGELAININIKGQINEKLTFFNKNETESKSTSNNRKNLDEKSTNEDEFTFEDYHINKLINNNDQNKENNIIDDFNSYFHLNLSIIYAKLAGIKINFQNIKETEASIYLLICLRTKKIVLNRPEKKDENFLRFNTYTNKRPKNFFKEEREDNIKKFQTTKINENIKRRRNTIGESKLFKFSPGLRNSRPQSLENEDFINFNDQISSNRTENYKFEIYFDYKKYKESLDGIFNLESSSEISPSKEINIDKEKEIIFSDRMNKACQSGSRKNKIQLESFSRNIDTDIFNSSYNPPLNYENRLMNRYNQAGESLFKENFINETISDEVKQSKSLKSLSILSQYSSNNFSESSKIAKKQKIIRVLLCDDEPLIKKTLTKFLHKIFQNHNENLFEIIEANDGFDCITKIYKYYLKEKYFDLLIIDETMPLMNGSHVILLIKRIVNDKNFKDIKIVSYTSYNTLDKLEFLYSQGADYVLSKPVSYEEFEYFFVQSIFKLPLSQ
jgi:CheY-like chemotaxis protein